MKFPNDEERAISKGSKAWNEWREKEESRVVQGWVDFQERDDPYDGVEYTEPKEYLPDFRGSELSFLHRGFSKAEWTGFHLKDLAGVNLSKANLTGSYLVPLNRRISSSTRPVLDSSTHRKLMSTYL